MIKIPKVTFDVGDNPLDPTMLPIYGPADSDEKRKIAGWINADYKPLLCSMLEFADQNMQEDNDGKGN